MTRIAVVGAGGFVGSRMIEMAALGEGRIDGCEVIPVVRGFRNLAATARLGPREYRFADLSKPATLPAALNDCEAVVNLTMGDESRTLPDLRNLYTACATIGVPLLIHVSSAEVFGRCDTAGLTDDSDWQRDHWMAYARQKGKAEDWLRALKAANGPSVVTLRPGLIWGPKSSWVAGPAKSIFDGVAYLVNGGDGACNLCYVDNLVHMIAVIARSSRRETAFFNVGDPDRPTWRAYFDGLANEMGLADYPFHTVPEREFREPLISRLVALKDVPLAKAIKKRMQSETKQWMKYELARMRDLLYPPVPANRSLPIVTKGMWWLQTTRYHLSTEKFEHSYPSDRYTGFREGMINTGNWLRLTGFSAR